MPGGTLYVYVPGIGRDESTAMLARIEERATELAAARGAPPPELRTFRHRVRAGSARRSLQLGVVAERLEQRITMWADQVEPTEVVIIGHSMGGLLARSAWLINRGFDFPWGQARGGILQDDTGWAAKTSRIVLLGVPNGGFVLRKRSWRLLYALATPWRDFAVEQARQGGYWVTNLRLRWLHAFRALSKDQLGTGEAGSVSVDQAAPAASRVPYVVEILGENDELVGDGDVGDSVFLPAHREPKVPDTDHGQLVDLSDPATSADRWWVLDHALFEDPEPVAVAPTEDRDVGFILHGIRAGNTDPWISDTTKRLEDAGWYVESPNTGWFSAWEFALPGVRNRKTHEFLEIYGDVARTHDMDRFAFFGHSNGTYMAARALAQVPAIRFRRMLLAGTVLTPHYDWQLVFARQQIGEWVPGASPRRWQDGVVHNERAYRDVPVGVLCSLLAGLRLKARSVGPGGVIGFVNPGPGVSEDDLLYKGGHASALKTRTRGRLDQIVAFLTSGAVTDTPRQPLGQVFRTLVNLLSSRWAYLLVAVVLALFVLLFLWLATFLPLWVPVVVYAAVVVVALIGLRVV
jgi:pimeloyl-ACP methyl ester carboxylesterase